MLSAIFYFQHTLNRYLSSSSSDVEGEGVSKLNHFPPPPPPPQKKKIKKPSLITVNQTSNKVYSKYQQNCYFSLK